MKITAIRSAVLLFQYSIGAGKLETDLMNLAVSGGIPLLGGGLLA